MKKLVYLNGGREETELDAFAMKKNVKKKQERLGSKEVSPVPFVESKSSGDKSSSITACPIGWKLGPNGKKCFMSTEFALSWNRSEALCEDFNGRLAEVTSKEEFNFVHGLCSGDGNPKSCWIGGRAVNSTTGLSWSWSDGTTVWNDSAFPGKPVLYNCSVSDCQMPPSSDICTLVTNDQVSLVGVLCNVSHDAICMIDQEEDPCFQKHCHNEYLVILASVSGLILLLTLAMVIWLLAFKRSKRRRRSHKIPCSSTTALVRPSWKVFTIEELRSITKNFSEGNRLLGDAKTGGTYSGILPDGSRVAIKRLRRPTLQRKKEFFSEIARVSRLHHPNLVAVEGCCYDNGDRYIVYKFVANGPLDRWLHHVPRGGRSLDWAMRIKIAITLAQGIAFLHDKVKPHVVHRDIRASNVLLDEEFGAHLMGVGLSKFVSWEAMHERTVTARACGYLAPEFVYRNELTTKSDVYSFGVLLLEIVSGRRPAKAVDSVGFQSIFEWATPLVQSHRFLQLLDPLIVQVPEIGAVQKVVELIYSCTQHVPSVRPRMSHVVHQLQQLDLKSTASVAASSELKVQRTETNPTTKNASNGSSSSSSQAMVLLPMEVELLK